MSSIAPAIGSSGDMTDTATESFTRSESKRDGLDITRSTFVVTTGVTRSTTAETIDIDEEYTRTIDARTMRAVTPIATTTAVVTAQRSEKNVDTRA